MCTVATYNLYLGADLTVIFAVTSPEDLAGKARLVLDQVVATDFPARAEAIARVLVEEQVDVVGLQEVASWSRAVVDPRGERHEVWLDFLSVLLGALERAGEPYDVHASAANFQGGAHVAGASSMAVQGRNVILVRRRSGVRVSGERTFGFSSSLKIATGMPDLVLDVGRSWGWVDAEVDGSTFRFVNVHTEAWEPRIRDAQRDEVLATLAASDRPLVVVGDFNATPEVVGMPAEYVDAWAVAGRGGAGLTSGQNTGLTGDHALETRIDYVWVRGADVADCRVVGGRPQDRTSSGLWPSDHAGVVAEVTF